MGKSLYYEYNKYLCNKLENCANVISVDTPSVDVDIVHKKLSNELTDSKNIRTVGMRTIVFDSEDALFHYVSMFQAIVIYSANKVVNNIDGERVMLRCFTFYEEV